MGALGETEYRGYTISIEQDKEANNPREWTNFGNIIAWHPRYLLGDTWMNKDFPNRASFSKWLKTQGGKVTVLPVFLYDHSVQCLSTETFVGRAQHAEWDSGEVGFTFITDADARAALGVKRLTKNARKEVVLNLKSALESYSRYIQGRVYRYTITDEDYGGFVDSLGGCEDEPIEGKFNDGESALAAAKELIDGIYAVRGYGPEEVEADAGALAVQE